MEDQGETHQLLALPQSWTTGKRQATTEGQFRSSRAALGLRQGETGQCAQGPKLLFQPPRKRAVAKPEDLAPDLSTPEEIQLSIERNLALTVEARRQQEQNAAEAGRIENAGSRFTLFQRQVLFCFEIAVTAICLVSFAYFAATEPASVGLPLSGIGSIAGSASLLSRRRREKTEE